LSETHGDGVHNPDAALSNVLLLVLQWVVVEQSCNCFSRVLVPLYDTLGPEAVSYIINQACITVVACNASKVSLLFKQAESCTSLRLIIKLGGAITEEEKEKAQQIGISIHTIQEVEDLGRENPVERVVPDPDDTATICYTSGTTGNPKGVIITHGNIISNLAGAYLQLEQMFESTPDDIHISYLPLAHMFERVCVAMMFMCGAKVGFFQGDIKLLLEDIKELRPTIFVTVPRLLNRVYDRVSTTNTSESCDFTVCPWFYIQGLQKKVLFVWVYIDNQSEGCILHLDRKCRAYFSSSSMALVTIM